MEAATAPLTTPRIPPWPAARPLRAWQAEALERLLERPHEPPAERAAPGEGFHALSSSAHLEEVIRSTTAAGDALTLFGDPTPAAAGPVAVTSTGQQVPAYVLRERERDRRSRLVGLLARRTGDDHAAIHARVNERTGARSVPDATHEQLKAGNDLLERDLLKAPRPRGRGRRPLG